MGKFNKNNKNNAKPQTKKSNKFKQRTPDNKRELDKLQQTMKIGKYAPENRQQSKDFVKPKHNKDQSKKQKPNQKTKPITKIDKSAFQGLQKIKGNPLFQIVPDNSDEEDQFKALGNDQQDNYEDQNQQENQIEEQQFDQNQQEQNDGEEQQDDQMEEQDQQFGGDDDEEFQGEFDGQAIDGEQFEGNQNQDYVQQGQPNNDQDNQFIKQEQNDKEPMDISVMSLKIQQTIAVLMNVQKLGEGKPRKYYIQQLKQLIHQYYGYNFELIQHFLDFFNPTEMIQFFQANQTQRPLTIRTNTLKTRRKQLAQSLIQRGVNLDPLAEWSKVGIKIYQTKVPIGATPQYLAGQYMLQSASSLLPVLALDPQVGQKILDMASAPGGKTTYIAQLMKNTGCIFANDLKKQRLRALQFNLYRLGVTNTAVTCRDGRKYPEIFPGTFDRVLLDAPCTGLGIISKDLSIKANRLLLDIYKNSHVQKQLLLAAIDCCKVNGVIVYSTCSVSPLQNQEVVNYALKKRFVKIVDCNIEVGEQGLIKFVQKRFHVDLKKTRRIYPHVHNMDGFYVAKLVKISKGAKKINQGQNQEEQNKLA